VSAGPSFLGSKTVTILSLVETPIREPLWDHSRPVAVLLLLSKIATYFYEVISQILIVESAPAEAIV
jgi:hypothetical protein